AARVAPCRAPRRRGDAPAAGQSRHADGDQREPRAVSLPARRRRAHRRVLPAPPARKAGAGRRRLGHGRLQQPRSAQPVAEPGSERAGPRPRLQRPRPRTAAVADRPSLPPDRQGFAAAAHAAAHAVAAGDVPSHPPPAPLGRALAGAHAAGGQGGAGRGSAAMNARAWWRRLRPLLMAGFLAAAGWLAWRQARSIEWSAVGEALAAYSRGLLLAAALAALLAHACYCGLDMLSRRIVGHGLPWLRTLAIAF